MNHIWSNKNYKSKCQFLIDTDIYEYDITKANISILIDSGAISLDLYNYLYNAPKSERTIVVGKMQGKDSNITQILNIGIENARRIFIESNNIDPNSIISIRNDAIMYVGHQASTLKISDHTSFRMSGNYSSFYNIGFVDYLYKFDIVTQYENMDIKGLGKESIKLHNEYMIDFLKELFYTAQIDGIEQAISMLQKFHSAYINLDLDIGYYRELNSMSKFKLNGMSMVSILYSDMLTNWDKRYVDISFNESILRYLNRIYSMIYFKKI